MKLSKVFISPTSDIKPFHKWSKAGPIRSLSDDSILHQAQWRGIRLPWKTNT